MATNEEGCDVEKAKEQLGIIQEFALRLYLRMRGKDFCRSVKNQLGTVGDSVSIRGSLAAAVASG